ncbi:MAG: Ig-like domain-containing protein [Clostridia bacterium]|nr:Ig-like domain-containing protein [Clostridia bacterium]
MKNTFKRVVFTLVFVVAALAVCAFSSAAAEQNGKWITAWGTGSTNITLSGYDNITAFVGQITARTVITPTASGDRLRVRLSNHFGDEPLTLDTVTVAKSLGGSRIDPQTVRYVTFDGSPSVTIPVGAEIYSDEIVFPVKAMQDIALSVWLKNFGNIKTMGLSGGETYLSVGEDDKTRDAAMGIANAIDDTFLRIFESVGIGLDRSLSYSIIHVVPLFSSVDVYNSSPDSYSVVVIGDSTVSNDFPKYLAEQINQTDTTDVGVVGKGIIGNSLGRDGLGFGSFLFGESMMKRFERDVLSQSGVKYVIVKIGVNDIVHPVCQDVMEENPGIRQPTAQEIIENFRTVFRTCHANNLKVIAVGITQWKGYTRDFLNTGPRYVRTEEELEADFEIAHEVNRWLSITTEHDGYVDYYDITKNPEDPEAMLPEYTLDGAHPTDLCQRVWAREFPLGLIGIGGRVGGVRLNTAEMNLQIGKTQKLTATVIPEYARNKNVSWATSNSSVATVDQNGNVRGVGPGTCEIVVETEEGARRAHCIVHVTVPVTGVTLTPQTASVYTTKTLKLSATVSPANATNKQLVWTSDKPTVASVSSAGVVTGVGSGSAIITVKTVDGGYHASCVISVFKKVEVTGISISATSRSLYVGNTFQLKANVEPTTATFPQITWKSDNPAVATVDQFGLVRAVGVGTTYISAASDDNPFIVKKCKITSGIQATGVTLNATSVELYETATKMLVPTITPANATNKKVIWSSSDPSVASVNVDGVVTAVSQGTAVITCTTQDSSRTAKCTVKVLKTIKSKSVSLDSKRLTLNDGTSATLTASIKPDNVSITSLNWRSTNKKVATVNENGVIKAVGPGTCKIVATTKDTGKKAVCKVTVVETPVKRVKLSRSTLTLAMNKTYTLKATTVPSYATNQKMTWTTSNKKIVRVSKTGKIRAVAPGTATVTVISQDGGHKATCTVTVKRPKIQSLATEQTTMEMGLGTKQAIVLIPTPAGASTTKVKYVSSNKSVAKVSSSGVVSAVGEGTAIITITPNDGGGGRGTMVVVKVERKDVVGIKLDRNLMTMNVGNTTKLKATILPEDATNQSVTWTSSNTNVCTVDKNGNVKAVGTGTCRLTCTSNDPYNSARASCWVTVR